MASPSQSPSLQPTQPPPSDLTDETQDFRFLSALSIQSSTSPATAPQSLPRRGEKDFEPHGTESQSSTLVASRDAMHEALSYIRFQAPKNALIGTLNLESGMTRVEKGKGPHARTMGKEGPRGWELLPEEALYLVERGNLDLRWRETRQAEEVGAEDDGLPMSLQAAYAFLVGASGLTVERYLVYAGLKRSGYVVQRGPAWSEGDKEKDIVAPREVADVGQGWKQWWSTLFDYRVPKQSPTGPLVGKGLYRNYNDIYRLLSIVPCHDPSLHTQRETSSTNIGTSVDENIHSTAKDPPVRACFCVWKPSTTFKKSATGSPDFRVAVMDARESSFPTLHQLDGLLQSVPYDPPPMKQTTQRLKHGYRNVILAIVDQGVVSYIRIADAGFCKEKIYDRGGRGLAQKKGGGKGKGKAPGKDRQQ